MTLRVAAVLALLAAGSLTGCLATAPPEGLATAHLAPGPVLPTFDVPDATREGRTPTSASFTWHGNAPVAVSERNFGVIPVRALAHNTSYPFPVPPGLPLRITATLTWRTDDDIDMFVDAANGTALCAGLLGRGSPRESCFVRIDEPLRDEETWSVVVDPFMTTQETAYDLLLLYEVVPPRLLAAPDPARIATLPFAWDGRVGTGACLPGFLCEFVVTDGERTFIPDILGRPLAVRAQASWQAASPASERMVLQVQARQSCGDSCVNVRILRELAGPSPLSVDLVPVQLDEDEALGVELRNPDPQEPLGIARNTFATTGQDFYLEGEVRYELPPED
jgi:hypothetical protein